MFDGNVVEYIVKYLDKAQNVATPDHGIGVYRYLPADYLCTAVRGTYIKLAAPTSPGSNMCRSRQVDVTRRNRPQWNGLE